MNDGLVRWLWRDYLRRHLPLLFCAFILMALEGGMLGLLSWIIKPMFDQVFVAGDRGAIFWVAVGVFAIFMVRALAGFGNRVLMSAVGQKVSAALQSDMLRHMLRLDSAFFKENAPGVLIERVRGDTLAVSTVWHTVLGALGRDVVALLSLFAVAISIDWVWTLIAVAAAPVLMGPMVILQRWVRNNARHGREVAADLATRLDESFHGIDTIKLNTVEDYEARRFDNALTRYVRALIKTEASHAGIPAIMDVVAAVGFLGVLSYGGLQIIDGEKTVGEFMSFFTAMALVFEPLRRIGNVAGTWQAAMASLERLYAVFRAKPTITDPVSPRELPKNARQADVVLDNVSFAYDDSPVLQATSFVAEAGKTTALVGASGAGKSTVFRILTRLADPQEGEARIGDVAVTDVAIQDLRELFAVVTQDAQLFDESVRRNVVLTQPDTALVDALDAAHVSDFLPQLSEGVETRAGPRGSSLSGGQRQRVAIARAVLRDAPILLLDEATSALDAQSEALVQDALDNLAKDRTTIVIAHRLSTIRSADKIVVMDRGRVVEQGSHDELMAHDGYYAKLHALQFDE